MKTPVEMFAGRDDDDGDSVVSSAAGGNNASEDERSNFDRRLLGLLTMTCGQPPPEGGLAVRGSGWTPDCRVYTGLRLCVKRLTEKNQPTSN